MGLYPNGTIESKSEPQAEQILELLQKQPARGVEAKLVSIDQAPSNTELTAENLQLLQLRKVSGGMSGSPPAGRLMLAFIDIILFLFIIVPVPVSTLLPVHRNLFCTEQVDKTQDFRS